jgi:pimeloyl-ACP methyl ester carboxylesterase
MFDCGAERVNNMTAGGGGFEAVELEAAGARVRALARPGPRPVVFVHGLSASSAYFADAADRAELAGRGLLAIDLPGFGGSPAPAGFGFTVDEQAAVVAAAAERAGGDAITLVGHSLGGTIALVVAERLGPRVAALVLAEAILTYDPALWSEQIARMSEDAWAEAFAAIQRRPDIYARGSMLRRNKAAVERIAPCVLQTTAHAMRASAVALQEAQLREGYYARYLALARPKTFVFGDLHDNTAFFAALKRDGARIAVVPRAGHLMMIDNPDAFYAIVVNGER